jgi:hypothetical protein
VDIKDLQILIKNVGKNQKAIEIRTDVINISYKINYDNQTIKRLKDSYTKFILIDEIKQKGIITKINRLKDGTKKDNYAFKPRGAKYIAYHISFPIPANNINNLILAQYLLINM